MEEDGGTEVLFEIDTDGEFKEMFEEMWSKALNVLKEIVEK